MTIYNLGNVKGEKGDRGECAPGPTGPAGVGIKSIEQINPARFKFCLTDGSEYIMVYGSQPATLSLVSDKDILVPDEVANITATVLDENDNPLSGQTVTIEVRKQSDDSLVETLSVTDEGDGTYTASYLGQGTGDIYIKADCMILSETYNIEDCSYYNPNSITSTTSVDIGLPISDYVISWKTARPSQSFAYLGVLIDSTSMAIGLGSSNGSNGIYPNPTTSTVIPATETLITLKYENGTYTYSWGDVVLSTSTLGVASKIVEIGARNSGYVKELKIKPL